MNKSLMLSALLTLTVIGAASADPWTDARDRRQEARDEIRDSRRDMRNAAERGDWDQVQRERADIRNNRMKLRANSGRSVYGSPYSNYYNRGYYGPNGNYYTTNEDAVTTPNTNYYINTTGTPQVEYYRRYRTTVIPNP